MRNYVLMEWMRKAKNFDIKPIEYFNVSNL